MTDVELIKSKINIIDFINQYVPLKKTGRNFSALCPFHSEKTPSFIVSSERQSWYCFGACNEGGDVISFLEKWENIEFLEALKILAKKTGVKLSQYTPTEDTKRKEKLYEVNHLALEFYHYLLTKHKLGRRALEYLSSRGISHKAITTFTLGYSPLSWDSLYKYLTKKDYQTSDLVSSGLLVKTEKGSFYDRFRGRLIFPLFDPRGNIIGFAGRKLPSDDEREAKYINTPETAIYHKGETLYGIHITREAIRKKNQAVVVEGEFDLLASFQTGISNVVAIKGSALTEAQVLLLKRYTENLILALDSDFAGNEAAKRGIEIAETQGLNVKVVQLAFGKDPAECVEKNPLLWKKSVKNAVLIYDFIIDTVYKKYENEGVVGKKKIGDEIIPFLAKITNPIVKSHYVKQVANLLKVTEESIEIAINRAQKQEKVEGKAPTTIFLKARDVMLEEHLLSLVIQSKDLKESLKTVLSILEIDDFNVPPVKKIIEQLNLFLKKHNKLNIKKFSKMLTKELVPTFNRCFMAQINSLLFQKKIFEKEVKKTAKEVKKLSLRRRMKSLSTKIEKKEKSGKKKTTKKHKEELRQLLAGLREIEKT